MRFNSDVSRMMWSWKRGCQAKSILFSFANFVIDDLTPRIITANDPCFGDLSAMYSFLSVGFVET